MTGFGIRFFSVMAGLLLALAQITSASACLMGQHQPEVPEALRR